MVAKHDQSDQPTLGDQHPLHLTALRSTQPNRARVLQRECWEASEKTRTLRRSTRRTKIGSTAEGRGSDRISLSQTNSGQQSALQSAEA